MGDRTIERWAIAATACLAVAALWYSLYSLHISVSPIPDATGLTDSQSAMVYFAWFAGGAWQDVSINLVFAVGLLAMAGLGRAVTGLARIQPASMPGNVGWDTVGRLLVVGGIIGAIGGLATAGNHQGLVLATGSVPRQAPASIASFLDDESVKALLGASFGIVGLGMLGSAVAARAARTMPSAWSTLAGVTGAACLAIGALYLTRDVIEGRDPLLLLTGVVLFPAWSMWLGRRVAQGAAAPVAAPAVAAPIAG